MIVDEAESAPLEAHLKNETRLATSRLATVEVARAVKLANPDPLAQAEVARVIAGCLLVDVDEPILASAADLTSVELPALDAIHLASALQIDSRELIAYDRRLVQAAERFGLRTASPGA